MKKAFTLAEVLVTLGIIGVVSAMTVPTLMQNYQRKSYVTQLHKFYTELSQALIQYQTDRNAINIQEAGLNSQASAYNFLKSYFKIISDCGADKTPCFATDYKKVNGTSININSAPPKNIVTLASGQTVGISYSGESYLFELLVDINGQSGPNIQGRDLFELFVYQDGTIDDYSAEKVTVPLSSDTREARFADGCNGGGATNYHGCFGKLLNDNWEMTY